VTEQVRLTRTGRAVQLVDRAGQAAVSRTADPSVTQMLVTARRWWAELAEGKTNITTLAQREGVTSVDEPGRAAGLSRAACGRGDLGRDGKSRGQRCRIPSCRCDPSVLARATGPVSRPEPVMTKVRLRYDGECWLWG
jgi:hypothetical protein